MWPGDALTGDNFADSERLARSTAAQIADLLSSGLIGLRLIAALHEHFPRALRTDVYVGVALGVTLLEADRIELIHELEVAERTAEALRQELADKADSTRSAGAKP